MRSATRPAIEPVRAAVPDRLQRGAEVGLAQQRCPARAAGRRAGSSRARRERRRAARCPPRSTRLRYSSTTKPSRASRIAGVDHLRERQPPKPRVRLDQARDRARHAGGEVAGDAPLGGLAPRIEIHVAGRAAGRRLPVVERCDLAVAGADHHEAAAAEVAGLGVHHRQRESHRDGGVHRVAALAQDVPADLARDRAARHHHRLSRRRHPGLPSYVQPGAIPATGRGARRRAGGSGEPQRQDAGGWSGTRMKILERRGVPRSCPGPRSPSNLARGRPPGPTLSLARVADDFLDPRLTERRNPRSATIDTASASRSSISSAPRTPASPPAVARARDEIARAIDLIEAAFRAGGRLLYVGAGTSGRLGVLDAAECPPTFGTPPEMVVGMIAGGYPALVRSVEGAEDDVNAGIGEMDARRVGPDDVVVGIAASGTTPYVRAALSRAQTLGARTRPGVLRRAAGRCSRRPATSASRCWSGPRSSPARPG